VGKKRIGGWPTKRLWGERRDGGTEEEGVGYQKSGWPPPPTQAANQGVISPQLREAGGRGKNDKLKILKKNTSLLGVPSWRRGERETAPTMNQMSGETEGNWKRGKSGKGGGKGVDDGRLEVNKNFKTWCKLYTEKKLGKVNKIPTRWGNVGSTKQGGEEGKQG